MNANRRTALLLVLILLVSTFSTSCNTGSPPRSFHHTLRDYAREAKNRGALEALVTYAEDEQEGEMLAISSLDEALASYQWVLGEPIEERAVPCSRISKSKEPDSIYTAYRFRVERRWGNTKYPQTLTPLGELALRTIPPRTGEVLVLKSGGEITVDGVLLKKSGTMCFSELMPRRYLLALSMDGAGRVGWLEMGCRSIFMVDGDRLSPRHSADDPIIQAVKNRFANSLASFANAFDRPGR